MLHDLEIHRGSQSLAGAHALRGAFGLRALLLTGSAQRFTTWVGGDLRTEGVVIDCPDRDALDLDGLDLELLTLGATSARNAAASRKLVLIGEQRVAVHQLHTGRAPAAAFCGQATLAVAAVAGRRRIGFEIVGARGRRARVVQHRTGSFVRQWWTIEDFQLTEARWRGRDVAFCRALNDYVVVVGPLPAGMSPAQARNELFGDDRLTNKLAIVLPRRDAIPFVAVETAAGAHGAIPATGVATLAVLASRSAHFGELLAGGAVAHSTKAGEARIALPEVREVGDAGLSVAMPGAAVTLSPLFMEF